jgi:hypothetical protein
MRITAIDPCPLVECHHCLAAPATVQIQLNPYAVLLLCESCWRKLVDLVKTATDVAGNDQGDDEGDDDA